MQEKIVLMKGGLRFSFFYMHGLSTSNIVVSNVIWKDDDTPIPFLAVLPVTYLRLRYMQE